MFRFGFLFLAVLLVIGGVVVMEPMLFGRKSDDTSLTVAEKTSMHFFTDTAILQTAALDHVKLTLEIAQTQEQRMHGLQFRETLADNHGMLFLFGQEQNIAMWMLNTSLSLDMLFLNRRGEVIGIIENTQPLSRDHLGIKKPSFAVLEMGAGFVEEHAIRLGDKLLYSGFGNLDAYAEPNSEDEEVTDASSE